jgi:hypothetical protein
VGFLSGYRHRVSVFSKANIAVLRRFCISAFKKYELERLETLANGGNVALKTYIVQCSLGQKTYYKNYA